MGKIPSFANEEGTCCSTGSPPHVSFLPPLSFLSCRVLFSSNFTALPFLFFLPPHLYHHPPLLTFLPQLFLRTLCLIASISKLDCSSAVTISLFILTVHVRIFNSQCSGAAPGLIKAKTTVQPKYHYLKPCS